MFSTPAKCSSLCWIPPHVSLMSRASGLPMDSSAKSLFYPTFYVPAISSSFTLSDYCLRGIYKMQIRLHHSSPQNSPMAPQHPVLPNKSLIASERYKRSQSLRPAYQRCLVYWHAHSVVCVPEILSSLLSRGCATDPPATIPLPKLIPLPRMSASCFLSWQILACHSSLTVSGILYNAWKKVPSQCLLLW